MSKFCSDYCSAPPFHTRLKAALRPDPTARGRPRDSRLEHAPRGPEASELGAGVRRGPVRWSGGLGSHSPSRGDMLPWPSRRWGTGEEQAPKEQGPSAAGDPSQTWNSGEEALGEPETPPQDSPQPRSPRPSGTRREQLPAQVPSGLAGEQCPRTPVPLSPQMAWEVDPSRMTLLAPWDPSYEAKAGPQLVWGPSCGSGTSFSGRTLSHPSLWPLYEAASGRGCRPLDPTTGHENREQASQGAGFPVICCEDVFFSDPLLPRGQRVPLHLSEASQQVMGSQKLMPPPPIMSPWVLPTRSLCCSTAWLSARELIALTGLLQMSQGEPRSSSSGSSGAPTPPAGPPDPVSDHSGPSGCPSCSRCTDTSLPWTPDTH